MDEQNFYNNSFNNNDNNGGSDEPTPRERVYDFSSESVTTEETKANDESLYENRYSSFTPFEEPKSRKKKKEKAKKEKVKKEKKAPGLFARLLASILCGAVFGACAFGTYYAMDHYIAKEEVAATPTSEQVTKLEESVAVLQQAVLSTNNGTSSATTLTSVTTDVTSVVDKVMPSMVAVNNTGVTTTRDWFGRTYQEESQSCGSGIIVGESSTEYFIATNHHVIEDAVTLTVQFCDGEEVDAYVKGFDSSMDIAVIAVAKDVMKDDTKNAVQVAEMGDSESLKIGEPAIAIGNALGYGQSVTTGVISALGRDMEIDGTTYANLIQTNAAINPGNSGGALLNIQGQVIGINSSKIGGNTVEGMGFAIPVNEVKDIIKEFSERETKQVVDENERGYLGISSSDDYSSQLEAFGYPKGVYVAKVYANSPAATYGVYEGDIITKVDGQSVSGISELSNFLSYYKAGETVKLSITRREAGKLVTVDVDVVLGDKSSITD